MKSPRQNSIELFWQVSSELRGRIASTETRRQLLDEFEAVALHEAYTPIRERARRALTEFGRGRSAA